MARRRRGVGSRLLAGLGEGLANIGPLMMRHATQSSMDARAERSAEAADLRQQKSAEAVALRQQQNAERAAVLQIRQAIAEGKLDPEQGAALIGQVTGNAQDPESLESVRPSPQRRMAPTMEDIDKATTLTGVRTDESIRSSGRTAGLFDPSFQGPMPEGEESFAGFDPSVREVGKVAGARRRSFLDAPEKVTRTNPDTGRNEMITTSLGQLQNEPLAMGPTPEQAGVFKGQEENAVLGIVGDARATQLGKEAKSAAQARQDVEMSPNAINARVSESARKAGASKTAEINAQIANAQKIIDFETQKAMANMRVVATEKEYGEWGKQIADAKSAASSAMPIIGQLRALWADAQPELERALKHNPDISVQIAQGYMPRAFLSEKTRKYLDLLESARPRLARVMGNVGNFTEGEQQRAGFIAPDFLDAANGGRTAEDKFTRMEKLFLAAPGIAARQRPGSAPITAEEMQQLIDRWTPAKEGDIDLAAPSFDILITPTGIRRPGGGR